ncbi:hypothetical protein [Nostoc sp. FACHB-888]|uniref:hypothetical protein n=1 Tax=Nostoc sp. FACHB-888 TaxID=2692842 RepID=UPI0016840EEA|nr:hypothetical protein [Nostoc sp. FACHB-888]MBD2245148.1 hypothetical protein [Nostoc sp. FACHB-888]
MKTIQELKTRIKELSQQAVEFSRKASEVCLSNGQQAKYFRGCLKSPHLGSKTF